MGLLTTEFAHVLLINCIHLENLLHIPESIEKVTASQDDGSHVDDSSYVDDGFHLYVYQALSCPVYVRTAAWN
jgi:hypothetical protein